MKKLEKDIDEKKNDDILSIQEKGISILRLVFAIVIVTMFSICIYSLSVAHYGNHLKWKALKKIKKN